MGEIGQKLGPTSESVIRSTSDYVKGKIAFSTDWDQVLCVCILSDK